LWKREGDLKLDGEKKIFGARLPPLKYGIYAHPPYGEGVWEITPPIVVFYGYEGKSQGSPKGGEPTIRAYFPFAFWAQFPKECFPK